MKRDVYKIKKLLAILISVILLVGVLPLGTITASAATSGTTGDCTWSLDGTVLTISGNGAMGDMSTSLPWGTAITSVIIEDGVTSIGWDAFSSCTSLKNVFIPKSVVLIKTMAFFGCSGIKNIYFEGSAEEWNNITILSGNDYLENATVYFRIHKNGDLNGDKTTNVLDFIALNKAIADNDASADVNSDGTVDARDLVYLKKILLGVI